MLSGIIYLAWNLGTVLLLHRWGYARMWRFLVAMLAVNCYQVATLAAINAADRTAAIRYWVPGEVLLLAATCAGIVESLWRAMAGIPTRHKVGVCLSLAGGIAFSGMCADWILGLPRYADWFAQFRADRMVINLCFAAGSLIAFGFAETFHRRHDPRFVRMHCGLVATLACGHVLLADLTHWSRSRALYRALEAACCLGWLVNASLLRRESGMLPALTPADRSTPRSLALLLPSVRSWLPTSHTDAPAAPSVPASRRGASPVAVWPPLPPDAHAGT